MAPQPNPNRRDEILRIAERRFATRGFLATSIAEIIDEAGIAKGTFYHHFSSKEALMHAIIDRRVGELVGHGEAVAADRKRPALQRLLSLFQLDGGERDELTGELERDGNELMHLRALDATAVALTPIIARILEDGRASGEFRFVDAEATAAAFVAVTAQLVDRDLAGWLRDGELERLAGLLAAAEQLLGAEPGALRPLAAAFTADAAAEPEARPRPQSQPSTPASAEP